MHSSLFRRRILAILLTAACATSSMTLPLHAEDADTLKQKQSQYAEQKNANDAKLASLDQQEEQKQAELDKLQSQLSQYEDQLNTYSNQITDLDLQMREAQKTIDAKEKQIQENTGKLKSRLCALYKAGAAGNMEILLSASNLVDLADRAEAVRAITEHDTALINQMKADQEAVKKEEKSIQAKRQKASEAQAALDEKKKDVNQTLEATQQFLEEVGQQKTSIQAENASLDVQVAKTKAALDAWEAQQKQAESSTADDDAQQANVAASDSSTQSQSSENSNSSSDTQSDDRSDSSSNESSSSSREASSSNKSDDGNTETTSSKPSNTSNNSSSSGFAALIAEAEKHLGQPYVFGASGPNSFDCSGFVSYVFTHSGVANVSRTSAQGLYDECQKISVSEARPGDLVFFTGTYNSGSTVTHVGIYVGSNTMIHAGDPIQYTSIDTSYYRQHFYAFGRLA